MRSMFCAEGGKENLVLQPVGSNVPYGIVFESFYGDRVYAKTSQSESFEGRVSTIIEGC
jgi:hypothetical protein